MAPQHRRPFCSVGSPQLGAGTVPRPPAPGRYPRSEHSAFWKNDPILSVHRCPGLQRPLPPPCPYRQYPGPGGPLASCPALPHADTPPPPSTEHQASAVLLESVTAQARQAGLQPQRPRAPECPVDPGGCPGCLGNHFRSLETVRSLISV